MEVPLCRLVRPVVLVTLPVTLSTGCALCPRPSSLRRRLALGPGRGEGRGAKGGSGATRDGERGLRRDSCGSSCWRKVCARRSRDGRGATAAAAAAGAGGGEARKGLFPIVPAPSRRTSQDGSRDGRRLTRVDRPLLPTGGLGGPAARDATSGGAVPTRGVTVWTVHGGTGAEEPGARAERGGGGEGRLHPEGLRGGAGGGGRCA